MKFPDPRMVRHLLAASAAACVGGAFAAQTDWSPTLTQATDTQGLSGGTQIAPGTTVHVALSLKLRNEAELDGLVDDMLAGRAATRLTSAQTLARFSPTVEQAEAAAAYLRASGFKNVEIAGNRLLVTADGTAAAVQSAFNTTLRQFTVEG
ncbi:MAG TPA: protease pro-enzyme activation domain-containing protein, partial [Burkholderiaceae bacterium]|nr:protease pro-enzyme activation domain-containing protein [Burkholderiaceae bacterium]